MSDDEGVELQEETFLFTIYISWNTYFSPSTTSHISIFPIGFWTILVRYLHKKNLRVCQSQRTGTDKQTHLTRTGRNTRRRTVA
ncbi:hypothetical protein K503DRAFT_628154 [Rhizopogon vinicolor AM-OR11-026]|uniref:Uncharacterized protein n=1 Tax=Rhizopogon vinicolor AM-OR11-026 TaxID=1314800 RepID=A0A1B7N631_9AGAM|nr:hypothetical protein K503DRAFT_628154 [Rhizopogon vinicolor AM-OR11-026]